VSTPFESTKLFGMVEIAGKRCSDSECGREPVAAMPWRRREEGTNIVWVCREHGDALARKGVTTFDVVRTCQRGDEAPCGATATHLAVVGVPELRGNDPLGHNGLRLVSVCPRHVPTGA
jgi:hypothetical protein